MIKKFNQFIYESYKNINISEYEQYFNQVMDQMRDLEVEYNKYSLDELKRDLQAIKILEAVTDEYNKLNDKLSTLGTIMSKIDADNTQYSNYYETYDRGAILMDKVDNFKTDLETMVRLFSEMGDLDKGSHYFTDLSN